MSASAGRHINGLSFVVRAAGVQGFVRSTADFDTVEYTERLVRVPVGPDSLGARIYAPVKSSRQTVLLVPGLHMAGIEEPRLVGFARELAKSGVTVMTPAIAELSRFEITPSLTDHIEQAALWLSMNPDLSPTVRVGMMGISFSGGPSIVAAGRGALRERVLYVFAFGAYDDLPRVLGYLCTGITPEPPDGPSESENGGGHSPPHDYGVAVVLLNVADHMVPAAQVEPLRAGERFSLVRLAHRRYPRTILCSCDWAMRNRGTCPGLRADSRLRGGRHGLRSVSLD